MEFIKKISALAILVSVGIIATGCTDLTADDDNWAKSRNAPVRKTASQVGDASMNKNFVAEANGAKSEGATDAALRYANEKAQLAQELLVANKRIREQEAENRNSKTEIAKLKADLEKTRNELLDANEVLIEMKGELKQWRADVLGYREEQIKSMKAILKSQQKILELLGAEIPAKSAKSK